MKTSKLKVNARLPEPFRTDWIAALRSGKYEQGRHELYNDKYEHYCCLGVGCRIAGVNVEDFDTASMPGDLSPSVRSFVPQELIDDHSGMNLPGALADMNDEEGLTFIQIADWLEDNTIGYEPVIETEVESSSN